LPVDPLNEWFALKVAVTRENDPAAGEEIRRRLSSDTGLTLRLPSGHHRHSSYELHAEHESLWKSASSPISSYSNATSSGFRRQQVADCEVLLTVVEEKPCRRRAVRGSPNDAFAAPTDKGAGGVCSGAPDLLPNIQSCQRDFLKPHEPVGSCRPSGPC